MPPSHSTLTISLLTHNRVGGGYLRAALDAILAQSYSDFELFVFDNHSTDETAAFVLACKDPRLIYVRQPPGTNPAANFMSALWMARGRFILVTHDDDIMEPDMVQGMMTFLAVRPDLACIACNVSLMDTTGATIQPRLYDMEDDRVFEAGKYLSTYLADKLWLPTPTCLFHRDSVLAAMKHRVRSTQPEYRPSEDILTLCLLNDRAPIALLAKPLLRYRQHPGQESRNVDQSEPLLATVTELLRHRRNSRLQQHLPALHAAKIRFTAQDQLFRLGRGIQIERLLRQVALLKTRWERAVAPEARALDPVLPFEILACQLGLGPSIPTGHLQRMGQSAPISGARRGYCDWTRLAQQGHTLFEGRPSLKRVAILGSMFTAFLVALDARKAGVEVVCCLDSAPARLGQSVLGIPVVPHADLRNLPAVDAVILSSERDHEAALRKILQPNLPDPDLPMPSWKDLALECHLLSPGEGTQ